MDPLGESRPPTILNPRLFLRDPLEKVTSQIAVERERERRNCPSTLSTDEVRGADVEASLSRRLTGTGFLRMDDGGGNGDVDVDAMECCWT